MVTLIINNVTLQLEKLTYSLKSKISSYLVDDVDRSKMKINILPFVKSAFSVEIKETLLKNTLYKIDLCPKVGLEEPNISLETLFKVIKNFTLGNESKKLLIDKNYNIIGFENTERDYVPYRLEEKELVEANVTNSYSFLEAIQKDADEYFLIAFPDLLVSVDKFNMENYLGLLVKSYIDNRFPVLNREIEDRKVITSSGFQLIFSHMKSILNVKLVNPTSTNVIYTNLAKMNLLSRIPYQNYWIDGLGLNLKVNRLKDVLARKESLVDKVKSIINGKKEVDDDIEIVDTVNKLLDEANKDVGEDKDISDDDTLIRVKSDENGLDHIISVGMPNIPEYFSHVFDEDSICMLWSDFLEEYAEWESTNSCALNSFGEEFLMESVVIIPEEGIMNTGKDEISFMGFDGDKFYISIDCKLQGREEIDLRTKIATYFQRKFGHSVDIVLDEIIDEKEDTKPNNQITFIKDPDDEFDYGVGE